MKPPGFPSQVYLCTTSRPERRRRAKAGRSRARAAARRAIRAALP